MFSPRWGEYDGPDLVTLEVYLPSQDHLDRRYDEGEGLTGPRHRLHAHVLVRHEQGHRRCLPKGGARVDVTTLEGLRKAKTLVL